MPNVIRLSTVPSHGTTATVLPQDGVPMIKFPSLTNASQTRAVPTNVSTASAATRASCPMGKPTVLQLMSFLVAVTYDHLAQEVQDRGLLLRVLDPRNYPAVVKCYC